MHQIRAGWFFPDGARCKCQSFTKIHSVDIPIPGDGEVSVKKYVSLVVFALYGMLVFFRQPPTLSRCSADITSLCRGSASLCRHWCLSMQAFASARKWSVPFLDQQNILSVSGCLKNASIPYEANIARLTYLLTDTSSSPGMGISTKLIFMLDSFLHFAASGKSASAYLMHTIPCH